MAKERGEVKESRSSSVSSSSSSITNSSDSDDDDDDDDVKKKNKKRTKNKKRKSKKKKSKKSKKKKNNLKKSKSKIKSEKIEKEDIEKIPEEIEEEEEEEDMEILEKKTSPIDIQKDELDLIVKKKVIIPKEDEVKEQEEQIKAEKEEEKVVEIQEIPKIKSAKISPSKEEPTVPIEDQKLEQDPSLSPKKEIYKPLFTKKTKKTKKPSKKFNPRSSFTEDYVDENRKLKEKNQDFKTKMREMELALKQANQFIKDSLNHKQSSPSDSRPLPELQEVNIEISEDEGVMLEAAGSQDLISLSSAKSMADSKEEIVLNSDLEEIELPSNNVMMPFIEPVSKEGVNLSNIITSTGPSVVFKKKKKAIQVVGRSETKNESHN